jgi:hypothetical protein
VTTIATRRPAVEIHADDPTLTPAAGLLLVAETCRVLDVIGVIDRNVGPFKVRNRGVGPGTLLVGLAESMLAGGDFFADLETIRADVAGAELRTVAGIAESTARGLAARFDDGHLAGLRAAQGELTRAAVAVLPRARRRELLRARPTIDIDPTDVEVYGEKERVGWSYAGIRAGRPVLVSWAEAGLPLTQRLLAGDEDVRPIAPLLVAEAVAALPDATCRPVVRADSGLFSGAVARAALANEADFAIAAPRNPAVRRAIAGIPKAAWRKAKGMPGAQVATAAYRPDGWPVDTYLIVRRYPVRASEISADPRARRRRSFDPAQLQLALAGAIDRAYAYAAFVTNLTGDPVAIEAWFRNRAWVEERIKDTKLGMAARHLPSSRAAVNEVWLAAALLALTLSVAVQALTNTDHPHRAHGKRLRRELIRIPGRVVHHARRVQLRLAPGDLGEAFIAGYDMLRALPSPAG